MSDLLVGIIIGFLFSAVSIPLAMGVLKLLGIYTTVREREAVVFMLFGKIVAVLSEPGLHFLWRRLGWKAILVRWMGRRLSVDLRLDQQYLRSLPVNSEEGAPMGIGVWYEMTITDPVKYLFQNADPRGSLTANVSNATVRSLSNLKLAAMLEDRHTMSRTVRSEVAPKATEWGFRLGSVYVRKVHFRDGEMIRQIEEKVVNRLRQVTSAIRQDGANQVNIITSTAERQAAVAFARAAALRPEIVGKALHDISKDPEVLHSLFEVLELQQLTASNAQITLVPSGSSGGLLSQLLAAQPSGVPTAVKVADPVERGGRGKG